MKTNKRMVKEAKIEAYQKARKIAHYQHCDEAVRIISSRIEVESKK